MSRLPVVAVERVAMRFAPRPWPFAVERRAEIDTCFAQLQRAQPALWNGRVLMMYEHTLAGAELRGSFLETDFASLLAWRAYDLPDRAIRFAFR
jgi:hypothetical protein